TSFALNNSASKHSGLGTTGGEPGLGALYLGMRELLLVCSHNVWRCNVVNATSGFFCSGSSSLPEEERADGERVQGGGVEAGQRVLRRADDRLAPRVEGRVDDDRHPGPALEALDEVVEQRGARCAHALQSGGAVHVRDRRYAVGHGRAHAGYEEHERV